MKYTSARERADKQALGSIGTFLKLPDGAKLWKPKEGIHTIDILPYEAGKGNPFADLGMIHWERTFYAHRGIGANSDTYLCPRESSKARCPVCEHRAKLRRGGDPTDEEEIKSLAPKERQIFNIIDRRNPDDGIQLWTTSYFCFGKVLDARLRAADERDGWEEFFHLKDGFSLRISLVEEKLGGYPFLKCDSIDFKPRDKDYPEKVLDEVYCLDDILIVPTSEVLEKAYLEIRDTDDGDKPLRREESREGRRERTEDRSDRRRGEQPPEDDSSSSSTNERVGRRSREEQPPADTDTGKGRKPKNWDDFDKKGEDSSSSSSSEEGRHRRRDTEQPPADDPPAESRRGRRGQTEQPPEDDPPASGKREEKKPSRRSDDW